MHCIGGIVGALLTGVFNVKDISGADGDFMVQLGAVVHDAGVQRRRQLHHPQGHRHVIGLRVTEEEEREGLDVRLHGERVE